MVKPILTETYIVNRVKAFLINDIKWNWHEDKLKIADLHWKWPDIQMVWWKRNSEHYIIECKWKSYAKSARSINKEWRLNTDYDYIGFLLKLHYAEYLKILQKH